LLKVDKKKVNAWLDEHWKGDRSCPICKNNKWGIGEHVMEVRNFLEGNRLTVGDEAVCPMVTVVCATCSYTMFFSAIMVGLVEGQR
jgi:predicted nucleic-acid-binding Zn-ribbon protein